MNAFEEQIEKELQKHEGEFVQFRKLNIFVATWDLSGANEPLKLEMSSELFNFEKNKVPDIIVLGI